MKDAELGLNNNPYLSIVMTSRNDDHGGNALQRMQVSLNDRLEQLEKYRISSELIVVEWNPPAARPPLKDIIQWPSGLKSCTIRIIIVPPKVHQRWEHWDKTPMNVVAALNCGIKRARGQYVFPGHIDMIYSEELMALFADRTLKEDERYRIDRCDVDSDVVQYDTLSKQLDFCRKHIIHTHSQAPPSQREKLPNLHTNAAGDFQLMSRNNWHRLRGYRETDIVSAYADGLLSFASFAAGIREVVLKDPLRLYHIDHGEKFNERSRSDGLPYENLLKLPLLPEKFNKLLLRLYRITLTTFGFELKGNENGIPTLHFATYRKMAKEIIKGKRPYIFNDNNWGLGQDTLKDYVISTAEWDKDTKKN